MRYPALESLRGLAALIVVLHHHLLVFPALYPYRVEASGAAGWLTRSPLHLLWAGSEAVVFFFVLSGFVLSLSSWRGEPLDMEAFVVRRLRRIWVPLMVAVTLAWGCAALLGHAPVPGTSEWFAAIWRQAGAEAYVQHALALGNLDTVNHAFIPVVWSLKYELWLSLLLPLVLLAVRQRPGYVLGGGVLLLALSHITPGSDTTLSLMRFLPMFALGALLARHREALGAWVAALPRGARPGLLLLALLVIPVQWYGGPFPAAWRRVLDDLGTLGGAALLMLLALGWSSLRVRLERPALAWLGRVSFSLYLYHALVLAVVVRLGAGLLPLPALLALSVLLALPVADLAHRWVEVPAMGRGRRRDREVHPVPSQP
ncbi:acyltransferase family protein [Deinococcus planocerae]|uniref:acyltransferase family protein n=1 Tax=Deinococcus planocerae TaxID=1737569 RepID=UPI000C7F2A44|nr:acyltransferase [Deinococcus planocerae]